jgi:N-acetylneuraminate lyase
MSCPENGPNHGPVKQPLEGLIAAPVTPMRPDGSVNLDVIPRQAELLHRNGVNGAFVCGTTGESLSLTTRERMDIAERWVTTAPGDLKVIVHVGHTSLQTGKHLAAHSQQIGAWGNAAMGPCFFMPQRLEDLVAFCAEMAAAAPSLPFYYYHMPSMTGVNFPMVDFLEAAAETIPNLAGIKYTYEDLMDFELCRRLDGGRFDMLFGRDEILICSLALGCRGAVGSTYNIAAPLYLRLIEAVQAGDMETGRLLQGKAIEFIRLLNRTATPSFVATKAVMKMIGVDCGPVRLPLRSPSREECESLRAGLERIGFFDYCSK